MWFDALWWMSAKRHTPVLPGVTFDWHNKHDINNRSQIRFYGQRHYSAVLRSDVTKATARPENIPRSVFERRVYAPFNIANTIKLARRLSYLVSSWRRVSDKWDSRPTIVFIYHSSRIHHTIDAICCDVISRMASGFGFPSEATMHLPIFWGIFEEDPSQYWEPSFREDQRPDKYIARAFFSERVGNYWQFPPAEISLCISEVKAITRIHIDII